MICDSYIRDICDKFQIKNYKINYDKSISVDGDVDLSNGKIDKIPIVFKEVSGHFYCHINRIISLIGCPSKVGGEFNCSFNQLTSLDYCPSSVDGGFYCSGNRLISLSGSPINDGIFCCNNNKLKTFYGCHDHPNFFHCDNNQITNFNELPEFFESDISLINNPVDQVYLLFNRNPRCIYWIREYDVIQGNKVIRDRLEEVFYTLKMSIPKYIILKEYILV